MGRSTRSSRSKRSTREYEEYKEFKKEPGARIQESGGQGLGTALGQ
jgi:hypothetical protein